MGHTEEYTTRVNTFRKSILTLSLFVMLLGGCIFALGVVSRPILRITKPELIPTVRWMSNVMVSAALMQIAAAGYDIFSGIWRLMYPIYLGIIITSLSVFLELTAVSSSIYLYFRSEAWVNEDLIHPWYWVECLKRDSCHGQMLSYIHFFVLPQMILVVITVVFQSLIIITLSKLVKTITDHFRVLQEAQEKYHDEWEEKKFHSNGETPSPNMMKGNKNNVDVNAPPDSTNEEVKKTPKRVQFLGDELESLSTPRRRIVGGLGDDSGKNTFEMVHTTTFDAQIHAVVDISNTPCSIVTGDHGYVAGSRVSLDFDQM